jgi:FMN phosphatase YigB (HAD superfamily)
LFDFHGTLVDHPDSGAWVEAATRLMGSTPGRFQGVDPDLVPALREHLEQIWRHAHTIDPGSARDLSPVRHREVFILAVSLLPGVEPGLGEALYAVMAEQWVAFDDTTPVLTKLAERGIPCVVVSNIGIDIRPFLHKAGLADKLDGVVLSYEVGAVKPQPEIFAHALDLLDMPAADVLMVGDSWRDDAGAAAVGIRTLILPRTNGSRHGLESVLRLIGASESLELGVDLGRR